MAMVRVLTTGGTIATKFDTRLQAATIVGVDELASKLDIDSVQVEYEQVFQKGSVEIVPADWITIANAVASNDHSIGTVVLHGTDTMQYTAAALSFMLQGLSAPVVLTGSMIPGNEAGSDAAGNLRAAIEVAAHADLAEVCVLFSAHETGDVKLIIRGTRAKKIHSTVVNAFASVNAPPLGRLEGGMMKLDGSRLRRAKRELKARFDLNTNVCLIKYFPSLTKGRLKEMLVGFDGAVFEGTGIGHIRSDLREAVSEFGGPMVVTTQCVSGGEKLGIYDIDKKILETPNVITTKDMLPEVALTKLMWTLAQTDELAEVRELMLKPVAGELR